MLTLFLTILALIWIIFAVVSDLKSREIPNWLNFSLIILALGIRFFYDIFNLNSFSAYSGYALLLTLLVFSLTLVYLTSNFKSMKQEKIYLVSISIIFAILIYLSFTNPVINVMALQSGFIFSYLGAIGLATFFILANILYFSRFFAGGDAKLMIALGPIIPLGTTFLANAELTLMFLFLFLMAGAIFGFVNIFYFSLKNFIKIKNGFIKNMKNNKKIFYAFMVLGLVLMLIGFLENIFFILGILIFIFPYLLFYARAIDNNSLVQKISSIKLTEGDWLYQRIKIGKRFIEPTWNGLSSKDIAAIKKVHKFVTIKKGIEFSPVFLISFLIFICFYFFGISLWNSLW